MDILASSAINAALTHDWESAIDINQNIIKDNDSDVDALSRLSYAYTQLGNLDKARKLYKKILLIDKYNFIAQKNLDKISGLNAKAIKQRASKPSKNYNALSPSLFLEEPGRTKTVVLTNIAPASAVSRLQIGDVVHIHPKKHSVEIRDEEKTYLGALPDDIAFRLIRLLKGGNTYQVCIKNIQKNSLSVFIKEFKRGKKFALQPSFLPSGHDYSTNFTPKELKKSLKGEEDDDEEEEESEE